MFYDALAGRGVYTKAGSKDVFDSEPRGVRVPRQGSSDPAAVIRSPMSPAGAERR